MRSVGRARGTPRIANRLLKRVRDYAEVRGDGTVDGDTARRALAVFEVDELGLDKVDRALLRALCVTFAGQPVGLVDARGRGQRGAGHGRGGVRAVPAEAGPAHAHAPGPGGDGGGLRPPRPGAAGAPSRTARVVRPGGVTRAGGPSALQSSVGFRPRESLPVHGAYIFLYLALLAVAFFILIVRPQRRQMAARRALIASLEVGDEVITAGGIYGTIRGAHRTRRCRSRSRPASSLTLAREAVSARPRGPSEPVPGRRRRRPQVGRRCGRFQRSGRPRATR